MRKTLRKFGEYLESATVNDTAKILIAVIGILTSIWVIQKQPQAATILLSPLLLIAALLLYFAVVFFSTEIIHWVGRKIVKASKWYPEWWYRPSFLYYFKQDHRGELILYIKSKPNNKKARLRLDLYRVKLINARDEQKRKIDSDFSNIRSKTLYDSDIEPKDIMTVAISDKSTEGKKMLRVPFDHFGVALFPGKYAYEFHESGTHKGANFGGKPIRLEFVFTERDTFEL